MSKLNYCSECGGAIQAHWKFCMACGNLLQGEISTTPSPEIHNSLMDAYSSETSSADAPKIKKESEIDAGVIAGVAILVAILVFVGISFANRVDPNDFAKRLDNASEYTWEEDPYASLATSDRFRALRGFAADNCNVYIYETEEKALDTAEHYLTPKMYWWGTDDKTGYGVVIADQAKDSLCTDQAADAFGWSLDH